MTPPERLGSWKTVHKHRHLRSDDGTREHPPRQVRAGATGEVDQDTSSIPAVHAHQQKARARTGPPRWHRSVAPGHSRSGFTGKLRLSTDGRCRPLPSSSRLGSGPTALRSG